MLANNFLAQGNLRMLWDVIMENEDVQKNKQEAAKLFNQTTPSFCTENEEAKKSRNLIDLNKVFLSYMTRKLNNAPSTLSSTEKKELVTHEQIQEDKQNLFQKDLEMKQKEFENSMKQPVPDVPIFKDNVEEQPISEMDAIIKKTLAERNFEMEQIHKSQMPLSQPTQNNKEGATNILSKLKPSKMNELADIKSRIDNIEKILLEIRYELQKK